MSHPTRLIRRPQKQALEEHFIFRQADSGDSVCSVLEITAAAAKSRQTRRQNLDIIIPLGQKAITGALA